MKNHFFPAAIITFCFLALGIALLHNDQIGYGVTLFILLPFTLGLLYGGETVRKWSLGGLLSALAIFILLLLRFRIEGIVCIVMALPIVLGAMALGVLIKYLFFKKKDAKEENPPTIKATLIPLFLVITVGMVEHKLTENDHHVIEVHSEISLPYSPEQVYDAIKSVDTLDAEKPFLMKLDLPIPQKCILEAEEVGALRTCYFEGGLIVERVTELQRGKILRMDVIDYQLTGRDWLGFQEAIYLFDSLENGGCKLTRITTYTSQLYPRAYWKPLEAMGIEQAHEYVFRNLQKDLESRL